MTMEGMTTEGTTESVNTTETVQTPDGTSNEGMTTEGTTEGGELPAYTPNFKFNVLDKEHEMDEWARPFIKDKAVEERFRDIFTQAKAMSKFKTERDQLRSEYDTFKKTYSKDYEPVVKNYNYLSKLLNEGVQSGDLGNFFNAANVPIQAVIRFAANTVAKLEQDPNYLNQMQNNWKSAQSQNQMTDENQYLRDTVEQLQIEQAKTALNVAMSDTDTREFAQVFDARVGKEGAFMDEVIRRGAMLEMIEKRSATPQEIISELKKIHGHLSQTNVPNTNPQDSNSGAPASKPVIPNIKGKNVSPVKGEITSTDDLRKIRDHRKSGAA